MKTITYLSLLGLLCFGCAKEQAIPTQLPSVEPIALQQRVGAEQILESNNGSGTPEFPCMNAEPDVAILKYYDPTNFFAGECYSEPELIAVLINAGLSTTDATSRAYTLFHTAHSSPSFMAATANLIGPNEFPNPLNAFALTMHSILNDGTCDEGCDAGYPSSGISQQASSGCPPGEIMEVVSIGGSVDNAFYIQPLQCNIRIGSSCDPSFSETLIIPMEDVQAVVNPTQWDDLRFGHYTERECWNLFNGLIVPALQQYRDIINPLTPQCYILERIQFNYQYNVPNSGDRIVSVYTIEGEGRLYCGPGF